MVQRRNQGNGEEKEKKEVDMETLR